MNRSQLTQQLMDRTGLSRKEARWLIDSFFNSLQDGLKSKGRVELRGFGVFKVKEREQESFVNPKNKQIYPSKKVKTILFQPSTEIK